MDVQLKMPDLGTTSEEIAVVRWLVEPGSRVERGTPVVEVETDKSTMEVEAVATGVLKEISVDAGSVAMVGEVLATIATAEGAESPDEAGTAAPQTAGKNRSGMFARNRARREAGASASGPKAPEPTATDRAASEPAAAVPLGRSALVTAQRMQQSKQTAPHFYLRATINAEAISALREGASGTVLWDAFFVAAASAALGRFHRMAMKYEEKQLVPQAPDAVGVAVSVGDELFVPVIEEASRKSLQAISDEIRTAVSRIEAGDADARRLEPAAVTITNLGSTRVESFDAVINPPQASILAVGRISPVPWVENGHVVVQRRATLTLSVDHRVAHGKYAADFLSAIAEELESMHTDGSRR